MIPRRFRTWLLPIATLAAVTFSARGRSGCEAAEWVDGRIAGPFICRADFPLSGVEGLLGQLVQLQQELTRYLGVPAAQEPIELLLFRDKATYAAYLKKHLPQVPYRRALYVKDQGPGVVLAYNSDELEVDVRHECTHALLHAVLPMVPLWLDEGLAEYFEVAPDRRAFGSPHLRGLRWNVHLGLAPRLDRLEKLKSLEDMGRSEYRDAWAWVHFMLHGSPQAHDELVRFLADIASSRPPGLLSQRLDARLRTTRPRLAAHFKSWKR